MKVRNSLKSLRARHRNNRLVRRKGRVYVINKVPRRFKARQGRSCVPGSPAESSSSRVFEPLLLAARLRRSRLWECD